MPIATRNQLGNIGNKYQGNYLKVLFLCSAGLLRSATACHTFAQEPYNWNTRSAATNEEYGLNIVNEALLAWADVVFYMEDTHLYYLKNVFHEYPEILGDYLHKCINLNIPDNYSYRDPTLVQMLKDSVSKNLPEEYK